MRVEGNMNDDQDDLEVQVEDEKAAVDEALDPATEEDEDVATPVVPAADAEDQGEEITPEVSTEPAGDSEASKEAGEPTVTPEGSESDAPLVDEEETEE